MPTAFAVACLAAVPLGASAAPAITVDVTIGQSCVAGTAPANKTVEATLRAPSGAFRGQFRTRSDAFGDWEGCFSFATSTLINGGDRLRVEAGSAARNLVIPRIEPRTNRMADRVSGWAPPGSEVDVLISHRSNFKRVTDHAFVATANASGRWMVDTTGDVDILGADTVVVSTQIGEDLFGAFALAPHLQIGHGSNIVTGSVNHGTDLGLTLRNPDGIRKAEVAAGPIVFGLFEVAMFRSNGSPAYPTTGDRLSASFSADAQLRLPRSYVRGSASDDVVNGRCMANAPYELWADGEPFRGTTDSAGRFTRDTSKRVNLRRGDELDLYCMYPTGDIWVRSGIAN